MYRVVAEGLVPVKATDSGEAVVDARELHQGLGVGKDYTTWIKDRIGKYGFVENQDYMVFTNSGENLLGGRPRTEYILKLDVAKELAMVENNEQGRNVRRFFIEVEKRYRQQQSPPIDETKRVRAEAMLRNARVREAKALEDLATKFRDILNPDAIHSLIAYSANAITGKQILALPEIEKTYTASEIAQELGVSANKVGRVANQHGLKTDAFGVQVLDKSPYSSKQVPSFRYNEAGRQALKDLFGDLV